MGRSGGTFVPESWNRRVLYLAGAWNVFGGTGALLDPTKHFAQLYSASLALDDPLQAFFFRATWINVIAWGIGYILAALNPSARLPILCAGGAGKLAYFGACVALYFSGVGNAILLAAGVVDVLFAGFFAHVVWPRRTGRQTAG